MVSAYNQRNSRLALPYGVLVTNLLRDLFATVKDLDEASLAQEHPINRTTIRRTRAQKQPVQSTLDPPLSGLPSGHSSMPSQSRPSSFDSRLIGDPMSVVVFTLTAFTERLSRLERANQDLKDLVQNRIQKLEDSLQMHIETLQMHLLEPLQSAASSASNAKSQMEEVVSSVKDLVNPAHSSIAQLTNQIQALCNDVGDLNRTFGRIETLCRRPPPPPR